MERRSSERWAVTPEHRVEASLILEGNSLLDKGPFTQLEIPVQPTNLSLGGIGLAFSVPLDLPKITFQSCLILLRKQKASPTPEIRIPAHVAYFDQGVSRMGLARMGLAFDQLNPEQSSFIESLREESL
ncbi:MAG: hypothetical protein Q7S98_00010 [Deltaproteobacteria bacterium]|nr:hypothetical protein [Deltaproteobacteria bacterium]